MSLPNLEHHGSAGLIPLATAPVGTAPHAPFGVTSRSAAYGESCMLPPLRAVNMAAVGGAPSLGAPLTLSDCSELSSSTCRDENGSGVNKHANSSANNKLKHGGHSALKVVCGGVGGGSSSGNGNGNGNGNGSSRRKRSRGGSGRRSRGDVKSGGKKVRSSKSNIPGESRYWTPSEHKLFIEALWKYGPKNLKAISSYVGTRNMIQCRTHEQKCFMRLMREAQRENMARNGLDPDCMVDEHGNKVKAAKDVYSVSAQCGLLLLCAVGEEMSRA